MVFSCSIRFSFFQSFLGEQASKFFSKEWNVEVNIGRIDVMSFGNMYLSDVYLSDRSQDTLAFIGSADLGVSLFDLKPKSFIIDHAYLNQVKFYLRKSDTTDLNLNFLVDYFSNDNPPSGFTFGISDFSISEGRFAYVGDSLRLKEHFSPKFILLEEISALGEDFSVRNGVVDLRMKSLSTVDHSGLELRNFKTHVVYDHVLIACSDITFASNSSKAVIDTLAIEAPEENGLPVWKNTTYFADIQHRCPMWLWIGLSWPAPQHRSNSS